MTKKPAVQSETERLTNLLAERDRLIEQQRKEIADYKKQLEVVALSTSTVDKNNTHLFPEIIGAGKQMQVLFELLTQVATSVTTVLITGETGTGKELVARAIHNASPCKHRPMVTVNCAAIPASLMESELFGHEKGSFTGAVESRAGKFEQADNSTLFLDEIGELPLLLQAKLLRVLQERVVERIGGSKSIKVNVRIIAATNRNLQKEVANGTFRNDLFYRLNVFPVELPPLRERKEDIAVLARYFAQKQSAAAGKNITGFSRKALLDLKGYTWPGNVRELQHVIERSVLMATDDVLRKIYLPETAERRHLQIARDEQPVRTLDEMEREYILKVVNSCKGRISGPHGAAILLGLPSTTLISRMQKLGIRKEHFVDNSSYH